MNAAVIHPPCRIIGVLDDGIASLIPTAIAYLQHADVVIGGARTLQLFAAHCAVHAQMLDLTGKLLHVPDWIRAAQAEGKQVVVLATGDPLCHGIAAFLQARLCVEACEVLPNLSTLQWACARVGLVWQDLKICSVHQKDAGEWQVGSDARHGLYALLQAVQQHDRVGIFTSPDNTPARIARMLLLEGMGDSFRMAIAARLLQADEQVFVDLAVADAAVLPALNPNIVLLWRTQPRIAPVLFGTDDSHYQQRQPDKGLITKREVRAVALARLQLRSHSVVWDIGAGSGAVGLEAARLCPQGHVYAIEKNPEDAAIARANQQTMQVHHYTLLHAKAPEGLEQWLDPDAVFIGGSGGELAELIRLCLQRLKPGGWLVMNFVTFENVSLAMTTLKALGVNWDVVQLQASRSRPILDMHRLNAENPVWVVCANKETA